MVTGAGSAVEVEAHRHEAEEVVQEVSDSTISYSTQDMTKKLCLLEIENSIGLHMDHLRPEADIDQVEASVIVGASVIVEAEAEPEEAVVHQEVEDAVVEPLAAAEVEVPREAQRPS